MAGSYGEIKSILRILKNVMKEKNILYADIAEAIGVSLPTVKRLMTDNDISLSLQACFDL